MAVEVKPSLVSIYIALNLGLFPKVGGKVQGFVDTGNNDDQCGHSAHHDGIYERFQKGDHTLFGRVRNLGRGMSNGCRANACLVGKNSPLDANNEYSQKSSESAKLKALLKIKAMAEGIASTCKARIARQASK